MTMMTLSFAFVAFVTLAFTQAVFGFDISRNDNLVLYWGQNSYGATHTDTANYQKSLGYYCTSDSVTNTFPIAFLTTAFGEGDLPSIDLANICNVNDNTTFSGTQLPDCSSLASDIETCQAAGKIVTLSIGGATGAVTLSSDSEGETFADNIWNIFLGGSSSTRPFGSAVLDGIDLDIEGGGTTGYEAFINRIRTHAESADKTYYITAAPQCPFPDANLGSLIDAVGFDAIYVQFYNNFCGLQNFDNSNAWNFAQWDDWAKNTSPNSDVKIYIGAPASSTAAGSGYVDAATLANIIETTRSQYSSFGGVMMWDASQAYANSRYDVSAKDAMASGSDASSSSSTRTSTTASSTTRTTSTTASSTTRTTSTTASSTTRTTSTTASTSAPTAGSCAGVAAWSSTVAYEGGDQVTYNDHLWTAKWWSYGDTPGGVAGVWTDDGSCTSTNSGASASIHSDSISESTLVQTSATASGGPVTSSVVSPSSASLRPSESLTSVSVSAHESASSTLPSATGSDSPPLSSVTTATAAPSASSTERAERPLRFNRFNRF